MTHSSKLSSNVEGSRGSFFALYEIFSCVQYCDIWQNPLANTAVGGVSLELGLVCANTNILIPHGRALTVPLQSDCVGPFMQPTSWCSQIKGWGAEPFHSQTWRVHWHRIVQLWRDVISLYYPSILLARSSCLQQVLNKCQAVIMFLLQQDLLQWVCMKAITVKGITYHFHGEKLFVLFPSLSWVVCESSLAAR